MCVFGCARIYVCVCVCVCLHACMCVLVCSCLCSYVHIAGDTGGIGLGFSRLTKEYTSGPFVIKRLVPAGAAEQVAPPPPPGSPHVFPLFCLSTFLSRDKYFEDSSVWQGFNTHPHACIHAWWDLYVCAVLNVCDMSFDSLICATWLNTICDMTRWYVSAVSMCDMLHAFICDKSHADVRHDSMTWLVHVCDITHSPARHGSFVCMVWLIYVCAVTHSYARPHSIIYATWLIFLRVRLLVSKDLHQRSAVQNIFWHQTSSAFYHKSPTFVPHLNSTCRHCFICKIYLEKPYMYI